VPLANASTLAGFTENTRTAPLPPLVPEAAVVHLVVPTPIPLRRPGLCETFENALVHHPDGLALDHDVEPSLPLVATGRQDHVLVGSQVDGASLLPVGRDRVPVAESRVELSHWLLHQALLSIPGLSGPLGRPVDG
jgi:hypothetical protein